MDEDAASIPRISSSVITPSMHAADDAASFPSFIDEDASTERVNCCDAARADYTIVKGDATVMSLLDSTDACDIKRRLYRCISIREGVDILPQYLSRRKDFKANAPCNIPYPPPSAMSVARHLGTLLPCDVHGCRPRVCLVDAHNHARREMVEWSAGPRSDSDEKVWAAMLVIAGCYSFRDGEETLHRGDWCQWEIREGGGSGLSSSNASSSIVVFYYLNPRSIDCLDPLSLNYAKYMKKVGLLKRVKEGFSETGLQTRVSGEDFHTDIRWFPEYGRDDDIMDAVTKPAKSLVHAINTFMQKRHRISLAKTVLDQIEVLSGDIGKIEAIVRVDAGPDFKIVIIDNTPRGFQYVHGDPSHLTDAKDTSSSNTCTLYLHHTHHPTIPCHERDAHKKYVLLTASNNVTTGKLHPYCGMTYPAEHHPYENPSSIRPIKDAGVTRAATFPPKRASAADHVISLTQEVQVNAPMLSYLSQNETMKLFDKTDGDSFDVSSEGAVILGNENRYLNDYHIALYIAG